jgi:pimeloyl-ACP methyl ester carboxylesterase
MRPSLPIVRARLAGRPGAALRHLLTTVAVAVAFALVATACGGSSDNAADTERRRAGTTDSPATPPTTAAEDLSANTTEPEVTAPATTEEPPPETTEAAPPESDLAWEPCGSLECATLSVPVDPADPDLGSLDIAMNVHRALGDEADHLGYLFTNPGGPGESGVGFVESAEFLFPIDLLERFDIVGFDPRGVGASEPTFGCGGPYEQLDLILQVEDATPDTPEEIEIVESAIELCQESMGDAAGRLGTYYVAHDIEAMREALGVDQISYLGYSYGSAIGVWYASLFPDAVRAMVVDGADNPVDDAETPQEQYDEALEETLPIEDLLGRAIDACADDTCPIFNNGDPRAYWIEAATKLGLVNAEFGGDPTAGFLGVFTTLYSESTWPVLWDALFELNENNNPAPLVDLAAVQISTDGIVNVTAYINCLDGWSIYPDDDRESRLADDELFADEFEAEFEAQVPLVAAVDGDLVNDCAFFDILNPQTPETTLDGAGVPILVVGNKSDPATPFGESEELAEETLNNGYLIEADHFQHTIYPDNSCVVAIVDALLLDLVLPDRRVLCEREDADPGDQVVEFCELVLADLGVEAEPEEITAVCDTLGERALEELGEESVAAAIQGDAEAATQLGQLLGQILVSEGLEIP